eukprot:3217071-Pyramimonas_sp.AAC.1
MRTVPSCLVLCVRKTGGASILRLPWAVLMPLGDTALSVRGFATVSSRKNRFNADCVSNTRLCWTHEALPSPPRGLSLLTFVNFLICGKRKAFPHRLFV